MGFLVGSREGFETVLFLQSLVLDAGGRSVAIGVIIGSVALIALGVAALRLGLKLPYFRILLLPALLIGLVLITFVGSTARALQTIGWLPVHRLSHGEWPTWLGSPVRHSQHHRKRADSVPDDCRRHRHLARGKVAVETQFGQAPGGVCPARVRRRAGL